jgi:hypothetical protein
MVSTIEQALTAAVLYSDDMLYKMAHLPTNAVVAAAAVLAEIAEPFSALLIDKDEITLILKKTDLEAYARRLPGHRASVDDFRLITFDVTLAPNLVGFMAVVSRALADAGVTIMAFAAFERDHLLVPAPQFEPARAALQQLQSKVHSTTSDKADQHR